MAAWLGWAGAAPAAPNLREPVHKLASVVRADSRSGRLVRTVAVPARVLRASEIKPRVVAPVEPDAAAPRRQPASLDAFIAETARRYDVDPLLVRSVIEVESAGNPWAISPKGAQGLMQLMPATARRFDVGNTFNPWENIEGGVRYLKYLLALFGDERLALAAYNAGPTRAKAWLGWADFREPAEFIETIPFAETRTYVVAVLRNAGLYRRLYAAEEAPPPRAAENTPARPAKKPPARAPARHKRKAR